MTINMTIIITIHIFFSRCNQQTCGSHRLPVTEAQVRAMEATQATRRPTHDPAPWLRPVDTNKDVPQKWCFYGDFMVKMVILWWRWRLYGEDGDFMVKMAIVWWRWRFYGEDGDCMVKMAILWWRLWFYGEWMMNGIQSHEIHWNNAIRFGWWRSTTTGYFGMASKTDGRRSQIRGVILIT